MLSRTFFDRDILDFRSWAGFYSHFAATWTSCIEWSLGKIIQICPPVGTLKLAPDIPMGMLLCIATRRNTGHSMVAGGSVCRTARLASMAAWLLLAVGYRRTTSFHCCQCVSIGTLWAPLYITTSYRSFISWLSRNCGKCFMGVSRFMLIPSRNPRF